MDNHARDTEPLPLDDAVCEALVYNGPELFNNVSRFKSALSDLSDHNDSSARVLINNCTDTLLSHLRALFTSTTDISHDQYLSTMQRVHLYLNTERGIDSNLARITSNLLVKGINLYQLKTGRTSYVFSFESSSPTPEPSPSPAPSTMPKPTLSPSPQPSSTPAPSKNRGVLWKAALVTLMALALIAAAVLFAIRMNKDRNAAQIEIDTNTVKSVTLDAHEIELEEGETTTLIATVKPDGTNVIVWSTSDESVATINQDGEVTAASAGIATITATAGDKSDTCQVEIKRISPEPTPEPSTPVFTRAFASSEYPTSKYFTYGAYNVLDGDIIDHVWCENAEGDGIGEWVQIEADSPQYVEGVEIMNGWPTSTSNRYYKNNRVKGATLSFSDGTKEYVTLDDDMGAWQAVYFADPHTTSYIRITIDSVYPGSECTDTIIAEVKAF